MDSDDDEMMNGFNFDEEKEDEVEKKRKEERKKRLENEKLKEKEKQRRRIEKFGKGRILVGGSKRRKGYAKVPTGEEEAFEVCPIISQGKKQWKQMSPFNLGPVRVKGFNKEGKKVDIVSKNFENYWQFTKVFEKVARQYKKKWKHPAETHARFTKSEGKQNKKNKKSEDFKNWEILNEYYEWRQKGFDNQEAIRRPNGSILKNGKPLFAIDPETNDRLDYIASRKRIYVPKYMELIKDRKEYKLMLEILKSKNILIIDVDGPNLEKFPNGIEVNEEILLKKMEDPTEIFGHGYVCALSLLRDMKKEKSQ